MEQLGQLGISPAVAWACLGIVLVIAEVFTGAFVTLFFGIGALIVAGAVALGLTQSLPVQILLFALLGIADTLLFRKRLLEAFNKGKGQFKADESQVLTLSADVPARREASISYQGAPWTAHNASDEDLKAGSRAVILRTEGIRLIISGEKK